MDLILEKNYATSIESMLLIHFRKLKRDCLSNWRDLNYATNSIGKGFLEGGKYNSRHCRGWIGQEPEDQGDGKNAEQRL